LEITTVAYIAVSVILYGIWWKKPKDVRYPIFITLADGDHQSSYQHARTSRGEKVECFQQMLYIISFLLTTAYSKYDVISSRAVPAFYADAVDPNSEIEKGDYPGIAAEMALGCIFGAIHCAAWSFQFQTHTELFLWRLSSLVVVIVPLLAVLYIPVGWITGRDKALDMNPFWVLLILPLFILSMCGLTVGVLAYILARLFLLILAFTSLRNLPHDALQVIPWTSIIPHFG
jgi:hypothetical protein